MSYFHPAPMPATPGTLRLHVGRYRILSDFGRCYYITNDQGRIVAAERKAVGSGSKRAMWRRGKRALRRLQQEGSGGYEEAVVNFDRYTEHREHELGIGA